MASSESPSGSSPNPASNGAPSNGAPSNGAPSNGAPSTADDASPAPKSDAAQPPARSFQAAANQRTVGTVRLVNAVFYGHHGVMQEEHRIGGRYEVDVAASIDFEDAAREDDLDRTVDYEKVYGIVRELVTQNNFYLIEKLAYQIADRVVALYGDRIEGVEVTVRKPNPPVGGPCDRAEAIYRRSA
jgi:dihydroneopterin aldolase